MGNLKTAHVRASVRACVRACVRPKPYLRDGWTDSFETLQQDDPYPQSDARLFGFQKNSKLAILWPFS